MSIFHFVLSIVLAGVNFFTHIAGLSKSQTAQVLSEKNEVQGSFSPIESAISTPIPTVRPTVYPSSSPKTSNGTSRIDIKVDTPNTSLPRQTFVYPGATAKSDSHFETSASGESAYEWYKNELQKQSYQIRNNIKTKANEKFQGVLQGISNSATFKVTITQENQSAKTQIVVNE